MKFYPSDDNFIQALLVMPVTNITSDDEDDDSNNGYCQSAQRRGNGKPIRGKMHHIQSLSLSS